MGTEEVQGRMTPLPIVVDLNEFKEDGPTTSHE